MLDCFQFQCCEKLAREIGLRSERKHVQQSIYKFQHAVTAASQVDRCVRCDLNTRWERGKSRARARVWFLFL